MEEPFQQRPALIGRDAEMEQLKQTLASAISGKGSTVLISGEPGIGKTALVEAFKEYVASQNVKILSGAASADSAQPFLVFSKALAGEMDAPLFEEQEYTRFVKIFAINPAGMLVAEASSGEGDLDADIFAGMLSAVQNFVGDSLDTAGEQKTGLGRLEYGDMKILIEHGRHLFLTGVFSGNEHPDMKNSLKRTLQRIEEEHGAALEKWSGKVSEVGPVHLEIMKLTEAKFLVRRDLEGLKLENERIRIADRVLECVAGVSCDDPVILLLEDLQWADESSFFVLNYLARNIHARDVLILGTARPKENNIFERALQKMRDEKVITEFELGRLNRSESTSIIENIFPANDFPQDFMNSLTERCGGIPLFIIEFLKHIANDGTIARMDGRYVLVNENYSIPDSLEEVIESRLEALDQNAMAMAEYASCIGRTFPLPAVLSLSLLGDAHMAIITLSDAGIITVRGEIVEFTNAMFHVSLYDSIAPRWKTVHHRSLGEYFEMAFIGRENDVIYELANHFYRGAQHSKAAKYCMKAGEKAESSYAMEQAATFYKNSMKCIEKTPENTESTTIVRELSERLGDIFSIMGRFTDAEESYNSSAKAFGDAIARTRISRKIAVVFEKIGTYENAREMLETALNSLKEVQDPERARLEIGIANVCKLKGDFETALQWLSEAEIELKKFPEEPNDLLEVFNARGIIEWRRGNLDSALANMLKAEEIASKMGEKRVIAKVKVNLGNVYNDIGNKNKSREMMESSLTLFKQVGDVQAQAILLNNIGSQHSDAGDLDTALECFSKSLETRKRIGDRKGIAYTLNNIGNQYKFKGEFEKARQHFLESRDILVSIGDRTALPVTLQNLADCNIILGDRDTARQLMDERMAMEIATGNKVGIASTQISLAELFLGDGELENAMELARESVRSLEETKVKIDLAMAYRILGMCQRDAGDFNASTESFDIAKMMFREMDAKRDLARVLYEEALLLKKMGREEEFVETMNRSGAFFESMGMKWWTEKCRKTLEELTPPQ